MNRTLGVRLFLSFLLASALAADEPRQATAQSAAAAMPAVVPGQIAVRFRDGTDPASRREWLTPSGTPVSLRPLIDGTAPAIPRRRPDASVTPSDDIRRFVRIVLPSGTDPIAAAREAALDPDVEMATPIRLIPVLEVADQPTDPELSSQWQHEAIGAPDAWSEATGAGVVIAIIDTGVELDHADLAANLWLNPAEADGLPGVDDDGNGYVDDRHGYDFTDVPEIVGAGDYRDRDADPSDDVGHGTWVAGAAASVGNNGIGGAGVAWNSRIMPLRAGFQPGTGFSLGFLAEDDAAAAIVYAVDNGADILNLSFGDIVRSLILEEAVRYAVDRGVVVVAAAGNAGDNVPFYPASLAGVLSVGASNREGQRTSFSTFGPAVQLLAPGAGIRTTEIGGGTALKSGTSLASPVACGALALLLQQHPDWSAARLIEALYQSSASPSPPVESARGGRLLRIDAALGVPGDAVIRLDGLDDGVSVDDSLMVHGSVFGSGVRGWRVLARPVGSGPSQDQNLEAWRTIHLESRGAARNEELARLYVGDQPETTWVVRVEALGLEKVLAFRERRVRIDHSPPVITGLESFPVLSVDPVTGGTGFGIRVLADADEPVFGRLTFTSSNPPVSVPSTTFERQVSSRNPKLGIDQPLSGTYRWLASYQNDAGLITESSSVIVIPGASPQRPSRHDAPDAATYLPILLDLDGDGHHDLIGESRQRTGPFYGDLRAWSYHDESLSFKESWRSDIQGIPRDAGDFDGDGRPDLLVLALQKAQVFSSRVPGGFPTFKLAEINDGWAATFIPTAAGAGLDIVTSFNTEVRIHRREANGVILDQALANPSSGINTISPAIVRLKDGAGEGIGLATVDGDGDLIIWRRGVDGRFAWRQTEVLGPGFLGDVAATDLDGDGRSELAVIETIGDVPSPTVALRDGCYRLLVLRQDEEGTYRAWQRLGIAGYFPGNPVNLQGGIPVELGAAAEWLWVTVNGRAWRFAFQAGLRDLHVEALVPEVGDGPMASGGIITAGFRTARLTILPTSAGLAPPDGDLVSAGLLREFEGGEPTARKEVLSLTARHYSQQGGDPITLAWIGGRVERIIREPLDNNPPSMEWTIRPHSNSFIDPTPVEGRRYLYRLIQAGGGPEASIAVTVVVANPVTNSEWDGRRLLVEWTRPISMNESSQLMLWRENQVTGQLDIRDGILSTLLDQGGRRLIVELAPGLDPNATHRLELSNFVSDSGLLLAWEDANISFIPTAPGRPLALVRVRSVGATTLLVTLAPGSPVNPSGADFEIVGGPQVLTAAREDDETVRLTLAGAPNGADQQLRLRPSAVGPGGEAVLAGESDVIPFRLAPVAYPNPVRPGNSRVTFDWVPVGSRVTVHDLAGREIWSGDQSESGAISWDLTSGDGQRVAPGVYLYQLDSDPGRLGKLSVIN